MCEKIGKKNSQPFGKNVRKPQGGDFLTHTVDLSRSVVGLDDRLLRNRGPDRVVRNYRVDGGTNGSALTTGSR